QMTSLLLQDNTEVAEEKVSSDETTKISKEAPREGSQEDATSGKATKKDRRLGLKRREGCCGASAQGCMQITAVIRFLVTIVAFLYLLASLHETRSSEYSPAVYTHHNERLVGLVIFAWNALNTGLLISTAFGKSTTCLPVYAVLEILFFGYYFVLAMTSLNWGSVAGILKIATIPLYLAYVVFFTLLVTIPYYEHLKKKKEKKQNEFIEKIHRRLEIV
ncbi:hypothetical protein PFISCL1PPCAC_5322, partial [Pristionchus fissidentatus]